MAPGRVGGPRRRYRLLVWLDEDAVPLTTACAVYEDDVKLTETVGACEPFDTPNDALRAGLHALDIGIQLVLPI